MTGYPPQTRAAVETAIESLIALLDTIDGDPDLEAEPTESDGDDQDFERVNWL